MSEENEQGEEKPKDDSDSDEFDFYFSFTKPLVLDLPSSEDKAIAAAWVQKLEAEPESEEEKQLRINYLKLLLFVLQRGRLSGIFKKQPPSGPLQPFPQGFSILDMGNWMLDQDDGQPCGGGDARSVPYNVEISNDLREFVASQEIPNFGIQMYYAWSSDDPIHKWISFDEEKFPQFILDKIKQLKEVKSDEKSSISKNVCPTKKKLCDLKLPDKYSKKKVKSPQEIERSQGRSFHTYMGLVGRMGNFNDKCDDDPEKFQRQEPRKVKCPRRSPQKRCPANGGEAEDMMPEEEYDNLVTGLGGLNTQSRPQCQCPSPCQHQDCPDHHPKGGPQSFGAQPSPVRNEYSMRAEVENVQCPASVNTPVSPRRRMEEQCADIELPQVPQQRNPSPRSRCASPGQPNECPTEDKSRGLKKQSGVCICSSPPCTCPCPRGTSSKATSNANSANAGGRPTPERCSPKPVKQEQCGSEGYKGRAQASFNNAVNTTMNTSLNTTMTSSLKYPDTFSSRMDSVNRSNENRRPGVEVVHCYDNRNVDPSLYERIDRQWMDTARDNTNKRMDSNYQNCLAKDQMDVLGQSVASSRKALFKPIAQSTPIMPEISDSFRNTARNCAPQMRVSSPPLQSHPLCDYSNAEDAQQYSMGFNQQMNFSSQQYQQNYQECEAEAQPRVRSPEDFGRPKADPCRKSPSQSASKPTCYPQAQGGNDNSTGRMANMANVLQGMKQKTEAHREKCDAVRRSPPTDAACFPANGQAKPPSKQRQLMSFDNAPLLAACASSQPKNMRSVPPMFYSPQSKPTQQYNSCPDRGYGSLPTSFQGKPCVNLQILQRQQMRSPVAAPPQVPQAAPVNPDCYPSRQQDFEECEQAYEQEDECDRESADSVDPCAIEQQQPQQQPPPQPSPRSALRSVSPNCVPQGNNRGNIQGQEFSRQMPVQFGPALPPQKEEIPPQWASMNSTLDRQQAKCSPPREYQNQGMDVEGRCTRSSQGSTPRSSPQRSLQKSGSQRSSPGTPDSRSTRDCLPSSTDGTNSSRSRQTWSSRTSPGNRTQDMSNITWATPPCVPAEFLRSPPKSMNRDPRCQEPPMAHQGCPPPMQQSSPPMQQCPPPMQQSPPPMQQCPPPMQQSPPPMQQCMPPMQQRPPPMQQCPPQMQQCPPQNQPCPSQSSPQGPSAPPNSPCPQPSSVNYASQAMNAEAQYEDEYCDDDGQDYQNGDMNGEEDCEEQGYEYVQDDFCENGVAQEGFNGYGEEDNQNCAPQNFLEMGQNDSPEECYEDFQDMNAANCEPIGTPQNVQANRSMRGSRNSGQSSGQRGCTPNSHNRNQNCPGQCTGGMTSMHHH